MKANTSRSHKRFTHKHKEQSLNVARVFPFILKTIKTKHKSILDKRAWAELENFAEKQFARTSID